MLKPTYSIHMKAIQVMFDETLLCELDAEQEVKKKGRSAVLRRLVADYLERRRESAIDARYRAGYAGGEGLGGEFEGWEGEAAWPEG